MTFQLDTTGEIVLTLAEGIPFEIAGGYRWSDLSPFTQGYIEAMPWRDADGLPMGYSLERDDDGDWVLNGPATVVLFSEPGEGLLIGTCDRATAVTDALAAITDVAGFSDLAPEALARIIADCKAACAVYPDHERRSQATSAGAGAGFWEGRNTGAPEHYTRDGFPPLTVQLGDDGKVRFA